MTCSNPYQIVCVCLLSFKMKTTSKKKREIKDSPFLLFIVDDQHNRHTKKRGSLRFIWGRNDKQQCPIPTTIFNIRTKHTKTRDKTFDSHTLPHSSRFPTLSPHLPQHSTVEHKTNVTVSLLINPSSLSQTPIQLLAIAPI